ncbi:ZINC FINGER PROTEIN CONSTANS-LIKE 10 [Salix viminalis]|uniref:ZINC FINGER PROTEIN CONSTANS-LIKE 10 n=1 Tax=Salix viminalis TaxID=40686 RepID=A0A9Q0NXI7_SALVM|nr:ZINC FINGER PROTEIN CONSTANS-LIKE 10 [Salix viminalis]
MFIVCCMILIMIRGKGEWNLCVISVEWKRQSFIVNQTQQSCALRCDGRVHAANFLSRSHPRSLICDKCSSLPAVARCLDEKLSICQGCDCSANGCSSSGHHLRALNCYTGCHSSAEFSKIWSSVLVGSSSGGFDSGWDSLNSAPIDENCISSCLEQRVNEGSFGLVTENLNELEILFQA